MKKSLTGICLFFLISCSSSKKAVSENQQSLTGTFVERIDVDGRNEDWKDITLQSNPDNTFQYAIANSKEKIFVLLKVAGQAEQMKLLASGLQVWIDPAGKRAKATEVVYPVKGELNQAELFTPATEGGKVNKEDVRRRIGIQLISMNRIGFKEGFNGVQSVRQNTGFKAAIGWTTTDDLIYELAIPREALSLDTGGGPIALGFYLSAMERPSQNPNNNGDGSYNEGGMGRRGGFGGRRGGYGQAVENTGVYRNQWQRLYDNESFWTLYKLAPGK